MSEVCDKLTGACRDASTIIYAAPNGAASGACGDRAHPCAIEQAFTLVDSVKTAIKLALGNYAPTASLDAGDGMTVTLFGSGSTLYVDGGPLINVVSGGRLLIRDLDVSLNVDVPRVIECIGTVNAVSSLDLDNVSFTHNHATVAAVHAQGCDVAIVSSRFDGIGGGVAAVMSTDRASNVTIDRTVFDGAGLGGGSVTMGDLSVVQTSELTGASRHARGRSRHSVLDARRYSADVFDVLQAIPQGCQQHRLRYGRDQCLERSTAMHVLARLDVAAIKGIQAVPR